MPGVFSEWGRLPLNLTELRINTTLRCGQSFRWYNVPNSDEWRCVLYGRLLSIRQDKDSFYYRTYIPSETTSTAHSGDDLGLEANGADTLRLIDHYFNLSSNLAALYAHWSAKDPNFKKKASCFTGVRILRQDAWESLVSFICSSNNNIARISQMVDRLCSNYGTLIASIDGRAYYDFPAPEALTGDDVESQLRSLGFGYRARYIYQTAVKISKEREKGWLDGLQNPESPAFGTDPRPAGEMNPGGRDGYRDAHRKLLELQGVGPKVADCVCLMGLGWCEAVPVDTHVWQIARRDYGFGKGSQKSLTRPTYDAIGDLFRKLWGKEAGWAHSVLFTADLRVFSDRLVREIKVKKVITPEMKMAAGLKRPSQEEGEKPVARTLRSTRVSKQPRMH